MLHEHSRENTLEDFKCLCSTKGSIKCAQSFLRRKECNASNLSEFLDCEKECLLFWGESHEALFSEKALSERIIQLDKLGGGNEHVVYFDEEVQRVIKITCPPSFGARGAALDYLDNLDNCNRYLGESFKVEGICEDFKTSETQGLVIVISQEFAPGKKASREEIEFFLAGIDFEKIGTNTYSTKNKEVTFADVRPDNVIKTENQGLRFIDIHIMEKRIALKASEKSNSEKSS